jgi:hypothetical protein
MQTVWWLSVFMWVNGAWVPGAEVETGGWAPRAYDSEEVCQTRLEFARAALIEAEQAGRKIIPTHWVCSEGEALVEVPDDLARPKKNGG